MNKKNQKTALGKLLLSLGFIITSLMYALSQTVGVSPSTKVAQVISTPTTMITVPTTHPVATVKKTTGGYTDGSYTGTAVNAYYGMVQVKAVVQNGQLATVTFLQYPNNPSNSIYINNQAMPLLTQEAIQSQNASVSGVSGATFTSQAFTQSLRSALAQA